MLMCWDVESSGGAHGTASPTSFQTTFSNRQNPVWFQDSGLRAPGRAVYGPTRGPSLDAVRPDSSLAALG